MKRARIRGPWSEIQIRDFLDEAILPMRIACQGGAGFPVLASLWFIYIDGVIYGATQRDTYLAKHLDRNPRCAFEVAVQDSPYRGVRGQAIASLDPKKGPKMLEILIDRYLDASNTRLAQWLCSRSEQETALCLDPVAISSWDYSTRMSPSQTRSTA